MIRIASTLGIATMKTNVIALAGAICLGIVPCAFGQSYVITFGGASFEEGTAAAIDSAGNGYYVGLFQNTVDFDPSASVVELTASRQDIYVVSYSGSGALRFAFNLGNAIGVSEVVGDIAARPDGSFVVTGHQPFGDIDFDPDPAMEANRSGSVLIAGYDSTGAFQFATTPPALDSGHSGTGESVAFDQAGNVYVTGGFLGTVDFTAVGFGDDGTLSSVGGSDAFVASYSPDGEYRFSYPIGGSGQDRGLGITVDDANNVFVTGQVQDTVYFDALDLDGDGDMEQRVGHGQTDAFLASYDSNGHLRFAYVFGNQWDDSGEGIDIDENGSVYVAGTVTGEVDFATTGGPHPYLAGLNGSAFLSSYTNAGDLRFVSVVTGGMSRAYDVSTSTEGKSVIAGSFSGTADFDPGANTAFFASGGGTDGFASRYSTWGDYILAYALSGTGLVSAYGVDLNADEGHVITGSFSNNLDVDPAEGSEDIRTGAGQTDGFIARYPASFIVATEPDVTTSLGEHVDRAMSAPFPNPASGGFSFTFDVAATENVTIVIYDALGRAQRTSSRAVRAGETTLVNVPRSDIGERAIGVYYVVIRGAAFTHTRPIVLR